MKIRTITKKYFISKTPFLNGFLNLHSVSSNPYNEVEFKNDVYDSWQQEYL